MVTADVGKVKGPLKFAFSMRSNSAGQAQVFWRTPSKKAFAGENAKKFDVRHDGSWHDYVIDLPLADTLQGLRLDPSQAKGDIALKNLRLLDASGKTVHTWK